MALTLMIITDREGVEALNKEHQKRQATGIALILGLFFVSYLLNK